MNVRFMSVCLLLLSGCGAAKANSSINIQIQIAGDGAKCYVIVQGDQAVGGNCVPN